jgi:hypothetical protein
VYIPELMGKMEPGFRASRFVEIEDEVMENSNVETCEIEN